jgi:DinB superfamily
MSRVESYIWLINLRIAKGEMTMKPKYGFLPCMVMCILGLSLATAQAQTKSTNKKQSKSAAKTEKKAPPTVTSVLDRNFSNLEHDFVPAADAMPEDKYNFAPTQGEFKGVRTFALQVRHVAATNYVISAVLLGEKPPEGSEKDNGPENLTTKSQIMDYLRQSMAYTHRAIATVNAKNMLTKAKSPFGNGMVTKLWLADVPSWHSFDHYGQMVEYLRMNRIIPPASRK